MFDNETFIRSYHNVIDPSTLREVINVSAMCDQKKRARGGAAYNVRNNGTVVDNQVLLEPFWPQIAVNVSNAVFEKMLSPYMEEFYFIKDLEADWMNGATLLQKTPTGGGYHKFHTENTGYGNSSRTLAWMIYLNDVEDGGETEFPMQSQRIKPKANMGLIWPGGVTHFHRGLPPYSNEKLVLTGWLTTSGDVRTFHLRTQSGAIIE